MPPLSNIDHLQSEIDQLIEKLTGLSLLEDPQNFEICRNFVCSNFLYHRFLDIYNCDVWKLADRYHDKFIVQSWHSQAKEFNRLVSSYRYGNNPIQEVDNFCSVLHILLKLAKPFSATCTLFSQPPIIALNLLADKEDINIVDDDRSLNEDISATDSEHSQIFSSSDEESCEISSCEENESVFTPTDSGFERSPEQEIQDFTVLSAGTKVSFDAFTERLWLDEHIFEPNKYKNEFCLLEERLFVNELIWMLQGFSKSELFENDGYKLYLKETVELTHLTHSALSTASASYCLYSQVVAKLRRFICSVTNIKGLQNLLWQTRTHFAFAISLQENLQRILAPLIQIEKEIIDQEMPWTILKLSRSMEPLFSELKLLNEIFVGGIENVPYNYKSWERSVHLLSTLFNKLEDESIMSVSGSKIQIILSLLLETTKPFLEFVEGLIVKGFLNDPNDEFVIIRETGCNTENENFLDLALKFQDDRHGLLKSRFLFQELISSVLNAGTSTEILVKLGYGDLLEYEFEGTLYQKFQENVGKALALDTHKTDQIQNLQLAAQARSNFLKEKSSLDNLLKLVPNPNPLLAANFKEFLKYQKPLSNAVDSPKKVPLHYYSKKVNTLEPMNNVLEGCLQPLVIQRCKISNMEALKHFFQDGKLTNYLACIRKYSLLGTGSIMLYFCSKIFDKLFSNKRWKSAHLLDFYLEEASNQSSEPDDTSLRPRLILNETITSRSQRHYHLSQLEPIELEYDIPWPCNIVLNKEALQIYQKIFMFILKIKCSKYALDQLHFSDIKNLSNESQHIISLLRHKFLCFVDNVHTYFMIRILHSTQLEFQDQINSTNHLKDLLSHHQHYLNNLLERSFQTNSLRYFREGVLLILNLILKFADGFRNGFEEYDPLSLADMEKDFNQTVNFLKSILNSSMEHRLTPNLEFLAITLLVLESRISIVPANFIITRR